MTCCPRCRRTVSPLPVHRDQRGPRPGDLTVCMNCGSINVIERDGTLHVMRPIEAIRYDQMLVLRAIAISDTVMSRRN